MNAIKIKPIFLAVVLTNQAWAAENIESESEGANIVEEVVVTGFRGSLVNSMNAKRNATGVSDAIFAEDIADFPDNNLAESLQRIPGVAISRVGGEGRQVSVRGLGPQFTRVRVNGMEAMSSSGATDAAGGANRSRSFDFNTLSSDLFNSLIVKKTGDAETEEGSLGATIELRTLKPSDFDEFTLKVSGAVGYNTESKNADPKLTFVVANQFNDMFGAVLGLAYESREIKDEGVSTVRWSQAESFGMVAGQDCGLVPTSEGCAAINGESSSTGAFHPRIPRYDSYYHEKERTSMVLGLELTPSDSATINFDVVNAVYEASRNEIFMQGVGNSGSAFDGYNLTDYNVVGNTIVTANVVGGHIQAEDRYDELETGFTQIGLSGEFEFTEKLRGKFLVGTTDSSFDNPIQNTLIMRANGVGYSYDFSDGSRTLGFGSDAYQASSWELTDIRQRPWKIDNNFEHASLGLEFDINDALTLKGGLNKKSYEFETWHRRLTGSAEQKATYSTVADFTTTYRNSVDPGADWLVPNRDKIVSDLNVFSNSGNFILGEASARRNDNYSIVEDTTSIWAQLDFNYDFGGLPVSGNVGFRRFETEQSSTGWYDDSGEWEQRWVNHDYDDFLPSINIKVEPSDEVIIRFAYSEGIARPGISNLRAGARTPSVDGSSKTIRGSNPYLEPTAAKSFDIALEYYMSDETSIAFNVFKKEISSHVQNITVQATPASLGVDLESVKAQCDASPSGYGEDCNENQLWDVSGNANGPGGDLHGFELQFQGTFGAFGSVGENFGYIANYTFVESEMTYLDTDGNFIRTADLVNLSGVTKSATFYYENEKYSARLSQVNRGGYLTDARGRNNNILHGTNATNNVDFSASMFLNDNLKISFEALNLTNEADDQWVDISDKRLSYYHETGTNYSLGIHYKL